MEEKSCFDDRLVILYPFFTFAYKKEEQDLFPLELSREQFLKTWKDTQSENEMFVNNFLPFF